MKAIDPNETYDAAQVAALIFHTSLRSFMRHYKQRLREGFPAPISKYGRRQWAGANLIAWRDRQMPVCRIEIGKGGDVLDISGLLDSRARARPPG